MKRKTAPDDAVAWDKLSFGEFLRRTPVGTLIAVSVALLSLGWSGATAFHASRASDGGSEPGHSRSSRLDTFAIEWRPRNGTVDACLAAGTRYFSTRGARIHLYGDHAMNAPFEEEGIDYFCNVDCDDHGGVQAVCNASRYEWSYARSQGLLHAIVDRME